MPNGLETLSPSDGGTADFKRCLKHLRDGHHNEAFVDVWRALGSAPDNPFYRSYAGLLAAV